MEWIDSVTFGLHAGVTIKFAVIICVFFTVSRYGGVSVGGQLPVLELQPKTIQDVAAQLGRLLNVTGVSCLN